MDPVSRENISSDDILEVVKYFSAKLIYHVRKFGHRHGLTFPVFTSLPGASKSWQIRQAALELGRGEPWENRLGSMIIGDIRMPAINHEQQSVAYYGNTAMPFVKWVEKDAMPLIFWDEWGRVDDVMERIADEATTDNRIGNLKFPDLTQHVAAQNGLDMKCHSVQKGMQNVNRSAEYEVTPNIDGAVGHWTSMGLIELCAFVRANIGVVYKIDPNKWNGRDNFASFRTLQDFGTDIDCHHVEELPSGERKFKPLRESPLFYQHAVAKLGKEAATKANAFFQLYDTVGSVQEMIANPDGCTIPTGKDALGLKWAIASQLPGYSTRENVAGVMRICERMRGENNVFQGFVASCIIQKKPELSSEPPVRKWMDDNTLAMCGRA